MVRVLSRFCSVFVLSVFALVSVSNASTHLQIPSANEPVQHDYIYYSMKQDRCLEAFSRSDFEIAFNICTPLAELGFRDAQLVTGLLYAYGEGVDKNMHRAKIWLKEALKNGREDAARALSEFGME